MVFENLFVRTKRSIGGIQLDNVILEDHTGSVRLTKNPVEAGADITDHAIVEPDIISISGVVTDTPLGTAALGQIISTVTDLFGTSNNSNLTRSQQAFNAFKELKNRAEPLEIDTKLQTYSNMIITSLRTSQDKNTSRSLFIDITLEEVILTESETIALGEDDLFPDVSKTASSVVEKGKQEVNSVAETVNSSVLNTISGWF